MEYFILQIKHLVNTLLATTSNEDEANKAMQVYVQLKFLF